ncbi:bifunctional adenosylcobinamide kinase/adenosylcobinamide-phosphate guanylyltransferase [Paenibacillus sp. CAU 1782]
MAVLITGGARSGKSRFAEAYAAHIGSRGIYIATCQPYDQEMKERIGRHQVQREEDGFAWTTLEEPLRVGELLDELSKQLENEVQELRARDEKPPVVLLDCLTLWLTNHMLLLEDVVAETEAGGRQNQGNSHEQPQDQLQDQSKRGKTQRLQNEMEKLADAIARYPFPLLAVTNEVGNGIVPEYALGRAFRDEAGRLNQAIAASSSRVFLVTAGIPVDIKALAFRLEEF